MEAVVPLSTKRPRVGRNPDEILRAIEKDVECSTVSRNTRKLLTSVFTANQRALGDVLAAAASELDMLFQSDPTAVIAAVIEA